MGGWAGSLEVAATQLWCFYFLIIGFVCSLLFICFQAADHARPRGHADLASVAELMGYGALLAGLKSALAGSLGTSLAAGLAVTASTTLIAATPLSNVRPPLRLTDATAAEAAKRPTPRRALADHDRVSLERQAASAHGNGKGLALGHVKSKAGHGGRKADGRPDHAKGDGKSTHPGKSQSPADGRRYSYA